MKTYTAEVTVRAVVEVNDPNVVDRCVNNEDGWRDSLYLLETERDVIGHLAYNAVVNNYARVNQLEGWADLPDDAATMLVELADDAFVDSIEGAEAS